MGIRDQVIEALCRPVAAFVVHIHVDAHEVVGVERRFLCVHFGQVGCEIEVRIGSRQCRTRIGVDGKEAVTFLVRV